MTNPSKTRHDALCEFRCTQILTAARKVFAQKGYREATMDEIAEAAGVAKGTLYAYFPSKQDVYVAELNRGGNDLLELTRAAVAAPGGFRARLAQFIRTRVEYLDTHSEFFKIYQSEIGNITHPAWVSQQFRERYEKQMEMLGRMVSEAVESGEIRAVPAEVVACGVYEMTRGLLLQRLLTGAPRTAEAEAEILAEILWRGMKAA